VFCSGGGGCRCPACLQARLSWCPSLLQVGYWSLQLLLTCLFLLQLCPSLCQVFWGCVVRCVYVYSDYISKMDGPSHPCTMPFCLHGSFCLKVYTVWY
jgi:hypothetical protein